MSPAMALTVDDRIDETIQRLQKGVKHLYENGISKLPTKYILPVSERPNIKEDQTATIQNLKLPIIDFSQLHGPNRSHVIDSLASACEEYGFFQVVNHGVSKAVIRDMMDVSTKFFGMSYEERAKYMSADMASPVRYGTSFNQNKDNVFSWRDFLKLVCEPQSEVLPHWPSTPFDFREKAAAYANETKSLFLTLTEAILEGLGGGDFSGDKSPEDLEQFQEGSQLMVVNCFPPCPEPDLTLGMPAHSDYGFLTLLLQDEVKGLQIQHKGKWITVDPVAGSFVVNVGDHLEIFSNGRYKSVLHRVIVNSKKPRISVANLHSVANNCVVRPWPKIVDDENPRRYMDTDFPTFLEYISSREPKKKNFLESRKLY